MTLRPTSIGGVKTIWWYVAVAEGDAAKVEGTQMSNEDYESQFLDADVAVERLSLDTQREVVKRALKVIHDGLEAWGNRTAG